MFLSTCPSDNHYFKLSRPKSKSSCLKKAGLVIKVRFLSQKELTNKMAMEWTVKLKGLLNFTLQILSSVRFVFMNLLL